MKLCETIHCVPTIATEPVPRKGILSQAHLGIRWAVAIACALASLFVCLLPGIKLVGYLRDPALKTGAIPKAAWDLSHHLAPGYAAWAKERMEQGAFRSAG